jgi:hypothetical protein
MTYYIFVRGLASTPTYIGLKCLETKEVICGISTDAPTSKECRQKYEKYKTILNNKFKSILS